MMNNVPPPFDALWFQGLVGLIVGLALGSFTTMLSYRLAKGLSIVMPPSHCPHCQTTLTARDLVPLVSWLVNKGRCRHCGAIIGRRYLLIELATGTATMLAFVSLGFTPWLLVPTLAIVGVVTIITMVLERKPSP